MQGGSVELDIELNLEALIPHSSRIAMSAHHHTYVSRHKTMLTQKDGERSRMKV